jgi:hypothetical protein
MTYSKEKFRELVLYIAEKSSDDAAFGATKLNKILFWSDFLAYANLGEPITGATYQRLDRGPAPRQLLPVQRELLDEKRIRIERRQRFSYVQKRIVPCDEPNLDLFDADEIALVDEIIEVLRDQSATDVSAISHSLSAGWQIADPFEDIPYSSVFLSAGPPSELDLERGRELAIAQSWD